MSFHSDPLQKKEPSPTHDDALLNLAEEIGRVLGKALAKNPPAAGIVESKTGSKGELNAPIDL